MTATRRPPDAFLADGLDALTAALDALRVDVSSAGPGRHVDATVDAVIDGRPVTLAIERKAYCTGAVAREMVRQARGRAGVLPLVVADRMTGEAREVLEDADWSWFDRHTGHLRIFGAGMRVSEYVKAFTGTGATRVVPPIGGRSGLAVAYWLLAHPERPLSPTRDAAALGLAPSTISVAAQRLADAGLVDEARRAIVPELFWELAAAWQPERAWLAAVPPPRPPAPDPGAPSWRRGGTAAAAAWGAPVVTGVGGAVELYVPGPVEIGIAVRRYGTAEPGAGAAVLAVAPVRAVCAAPGDDDGSPPVVDGWPVAPKLATALDLAQDRARGREVLADWDDPHAVWR
jgi:hypothetical protein